MSRQEEIRNKGFDMYNTSREVGNEYGRIKVGVKTIDDAINEAKQATKPFAIIAKTVKGKGVSFMENQAGWHGKNPNDEQLELALKELKKRYEKS